MGFTWEGEVHTIREGLDVLFVRTKNVVMVRMYPPRYTRRDSPDIALLFGEDRFVEVAALNPGDWVSFEATMQAHGFRGDPEVMTLWHVSVVKRPSVLPQVNRTDALDFSEDRKRIRKEGKSYSVGVSTTVIPHFELRGNSSAKKDVPV